jgi:branched-chain amino acid transport system ATP-binding protein
MAEPVPAVRRGLVPTPRQVAVGDLPPARLEDIVVAGDQPVLQSGAVERGRARAGRGLAGPGLPLVVFSLIALASRAEDSVLGVLLPRIRAEFGINLEFVVALGALVSIVGLAFAPLLGWMADRVSRVAMIRVAGLASALGGVLQGLAPGVTQFAGARAVSGASPAVAQPASFPLMTDYYPPETRARVFTVYFGAAQAGTVVGPVLGGLLADALGWRTAVVSFGLVAAAAAMLAFLLREPKRGAQEAAPDAPAPEPISFAEGYRAARSIVSLRRMWYATPFLAVTGLFNLIILPSYFAEVFQFSSTQLGVLTSVFNLAALLGLLAAGPVSQRLLAERPGRVMVLGGLLTIGQGLLFALLAVADQPVLALAITLPVAFSSTLLLPAFFGLISLIVPPRIRGLGLQTSAPWQVLGLVLVPFVLGWSAGLGLHRGVLVFVPLLVAGGLIFASGASGVDRDIRAAQAATAADAETRRRRELGDTPLLVIRDLEVSYDGVVVVRGVDLDIDEGEVVALVGTNGAGKSTLLRALAGTQEASGGAIYFDGRDVTHSPPHENTARGVVVMPGGAATFPGLTVSDNLRVAGDVDAALAVFPQLRDRADTPAAMLSGGEQQMVGLAQAFVLRPRLLLIDELSLGLAPAVVEELLGVIRTMAAQGTTVVLVEQSIDVALNVAQRAVFLEQGQVRYDGPTADLLDQPDLVRAVFLGRSGAATRPTRVRPRPSVDAAEDERPPALEVESLRVRFGGVEALKGVSLAVEAGDVLGIVGANGAGKTTLFDAVSGFTPAEGAVRIDGVDVSGLAPDARARHGLGRSFQSARLFPSLTVRETIAAALERRAVRNPAATALGLPNVRRSERLLSRRVENLVDLLGLTAYADSFISELSTGTRRAVDLACVLALEPKVLLLDEPSSGLAQPEIDELGPTLRGLARQTGCAMVLIEHNMGLVESVAGRVLTMELGSLAGERG